MSKVDELKDRIIDMIDNGLTRFGFTTGPKWNGLTIEEKAAAILEMWDAPSTPLDFNDSHKPPTSGVPQRTIGDVVAEIQRDDYRRRRE